MVDRSHFIDLPEPPREDDENLPKIVYPRSEYLDNLQRYISALHRHLLAIQTEETKIRLDYTKKLKDHNQKNRSRRLEKEEENDHNAFERNISKIKKRRRHFREMLYDAYNERRKLLESMKIQKVEEEHLRRKLQKLSAEDKDVHEQVPKIDIFGPLFLFFEIVVIIMWLISSEYDDDGNSVENNGSIPRADYFETFYIYIAFFALAGFGLLYTFLRKYTYSGLGFTLLIVIWAFQWTVVTRIFWFNVDEGGSFEKIYLTIPWAIYGMYGAVTVLVSFGAMLGRVTPLQLIQIAFFEIMWYQLNYYINIFVLDAVDIGGPVHIHLFGAIFGVACAFVTRFPFFGEDDSLPYNRDRMASYHSNTLALLGTIFLIVTFPAFNAALAPNGSQYRVIVNTVLALCGSITFGFIISRLMWRGRFQMIEIQHATLAGGIAVAGAVSLLVNPGGAMLIGAVAGTVSVISYGFLTPLLERYLRIKDVAGVLSGHGIPGFLGGIAGIASTAIVVGDSSIYGQSLSDTFPHGSDQAGYQTALLGITIGIALVGGLLTGLWLYLVDLLFRFGLGGNVLKLFYSDEPQWVVPTDFERTNLSPVTTTTTTTTTTVSET